MAFDWRVGMGLDVYVGPLTRYYTGNWKLITQQAAEALGVGFEIIRAHQAPDDRVTDPSEARQAILSWRSALVRGAGGDLPSLDWDDLPQADYFTDKPDWDGYWAVKFLAARDEFPDARVPARIELPNQMGDPSKESAARRVDEAYRGKPSPSLFGRFRRSGGRLEGQQPLRYPHLHLPEFWLPADFDRPFGFVDPVGTEMTFGSLPRLAAELESLNRSTVQGDPPTLVAWRRAGPPGVDRSLEAVAKHGLAILIEAAQFGVEHQLPMKLDY
jgi:hypothetical protein